MSPPLSPETERRLSMMFPPESRQEVARLLIDECGNNLPFCEKLGPVEMERARFSVLKLSDGKLAKVREAIALAKLDWRDMFVSAGFSQPDTHRIWMPHSENEDQGS